MIPVQITQLSINKTPIHLTLDVGWVEKYKTVTGNPIVISDGVKDTLLKKLQMTLAPKQSGSGTPSPSNIRPISGWDEVNTVVCGVTVWDEEWESGGINNTNGQNAGNANTIRAKNYISIRPNTAYFVKAPTNVRAYWYDLNRNYISTVSIGSASPFTTPDDAHYMRFIIGNSSNPVTTYNNDISINYPSTDHEYHAYQGHTYTTDLPQTVYGGTLDVVSGVLTVDRAMVDLGTLAWAYNSNIPWFYSWTDASNRKPYAYGDVADAVSSSYAVYSRNVLISSDVAGFCIDNSGNIAVRDSRYTDATSFKTAMNGVQLCYELATPTTIQCDPQTVSLLAGENVIMGDGDMEITYRVKASA